MVVTEHPCIAVIDDEPEILWLVGRILEEEGYRAVTASNGAEGLALIKREQPELVLLDLRLPGMDGLAILEQLRAFDAGVMVVILSAFESFDAAVQAMKLGSYDFLTKPLNIEEMKITIHNALHTKHLAREVETLKAQVAQASGPGPIIGNAPCMLALQRQVTLAARHNITALILGESGTGKELLARAIHAQSERLGGPFVCIDCSTIPESLIESELFGYERGAFTGARERNIGRIEAAHGGTLFLDEIGNMSLAMQMKLLRVLQERSLVRLGGKEPIQVDIRLIAATNQDLQQAMREGQFREDLYYRLSEFPLVCPPLREREGDLRILAKYFLDRYAQEFGKPGLRLSEEALARMEAYGWPGNVRELQGVIKRSAILADTWIGTQHLQLGDSPGAGSEPKLTHWPGAGGAIRPIKEVTREVLARVESELILQALHASGGNKWKTAKWLGIDYKTLFNKLKQYGLGEDWIKPAIWSQAQEANP
jgi:DNA-binding NtrC family response regulator